MTNRVILPVGLTLGSLFVTMGLSSFLDTSTRGFFFLAVMLSTWNGGLLGGVLAALLGAAFLDFFLIPPLYIFDFLKLPVAIDLGTFVTAAALIIIATCQFRRWRDEALRGEEALALELQGRAWRWSSAAHDLKHPLAAIALRTDLLDRRLEAPADHAALKGIKDTIGEMRALVDEIQDGAQLEMGQPFYLNLVPADLIPLVQQVVERMAAGTGRALQLATVDSELCGEWDAPRIERVITNLLSNAVKYSPPESEIVVDVRRESEEWAEVRVTDRGVGIPAAELALIFNRFYRGSNVRQRLSGTGLGLAGSRTIAELHGGELTVESREGIGSTFVLRLPLSLTANPPVERGGFRDG